MRTYRRRDGAGAPAVTTRCETQVNYNWGSGSPSGAGVPGSRPPSELIRRPHPRRTLVALAVPVLVATAIVAPGPRVKAQSPLPNIVLVVTDDQRWDSLWAMPTVQSELVARGVQFENAMVTNAWCCPSRASILTGQYSHSSGVYTNGGRHGGFGAFRDQSTLATWLRGAGYRTGLFGKYFNGYGGTYIPPGWDDFAAFGAYGTKNNGGAYFNYELNVNGVLRRFGSAEKDYSTDVLASMAREFIETTGGEQPFFLLFAPFAPHGPATPAPRHSHAFTGALFEPPPSFNEVDVSDKPWFIQNLSLQSGGTSAYSRPLVKAGRSLLAVDEAIASFVQSLESSGRLSNTVVVLTSDNGFSRGEHRWQGKETAYEETIRVPLVVRYDALGAAPRSDESLVLNIDIAPTLAELAGVPAPDADGSSFRSLLTAAGSPWRSDFLIEHLQGSVKDPVPTYCVVRSARHKYVSYATGEQEFYDLAADPYELANGASLATNAETIAALRSRLGVLCDPPPPGFSTTPG